MRYASYVICTAPRSGSTLLCSLLSATGISGNPGSYFHRPSVSDWLRAHGLERDATASERKTLAAIFQAVIAKGTDETGVFGLRLQRHSFDFFMEQLALLHPEAPTDIGRLEAAFGPTLFIHLTRTDKVDQAVSYEMAEQTGLWHRAWDGSELERLAPPQEPVYDADRIRAHVLEMTGFDRAWEAWFKQQSITPMRITYQQLSDDPIRVLRDVLDRLGLDATKAQQASPGVAKLADATSRAWVQRFRDEPRGDGRIDP
ncbi:MAG: Stf0 family sulfotransferase [Pseudomonadota bacterium]